MAATRVLVVHGSNLNLLGEREPEIYGKTSLAEINKRIESLAGDLGLDVRIVQSNHEGEIVEAIQDARKWASGIIINPAGFTTTSVSVLDAIASTKLPAIEVHLSNIHAREEFRQRSVVAAATIGQISGFGPDSYLLALRGLAAHLAAHDK
ncbi:MAG: type II 3-dehydroquinate dehydratase [Armatimonadota bacterium]|nr:MAG: type II 3-dehydroquinate dehydratase [Armatimonadota bacterium]